MEPASLPDFTGLPGYAQGILYSVLAVGLALSVIIPRFGFLHGKETASKASTVEPVIAAVVVDNTALNAHTAAVTKLADEIAKLHVELIITREVKQSQRDR